jgi:hypothetical protein
MKLKDAVKVQWLAALRGGEYLQGQHRLTTFNDPGGKRRYDSSPRYEIGEEASRALGNLLLPELRKISLFWEHPDPDYDYDYTEGGMW